VFIHMEIPYCSH